MQISKVAISSVDLDFADKAKLLSKKLNLPLVESENYRLYDFVLEVGEKVALKPVAQDDLSALSLDFATGAIDFRRRYAHKGGQQILKAIGGSGKKVLDCTAGLGRDLFILASLGCQVVAFERSPIVGAMVEDALERASQDQKLKEICERIKYKVGDSLQALSKVRAYEFDSIYLDPMFAKKTKSALPKKDLRILQLLLANENNQIEEEAQVLLKLAKEKCHRVVVKRPQNGKPLADGVSVEFIGTSTRFDVYIS